MARTIETTTHTPDQQAARIIIDAEGVEWEVYVLNHDIEEGAAGCASPMARPLPMAKAGGCCS